MKTVSEILPLLSLKSVETLCVCLQYLSATGKYCSQLQMNCEENEVQVLKDIKVLSSPQNL